MPVAQFKEMITYNEPEFLYKGKVYSICHPANTFHVSADGHPEYLNLAFDSVDDLLDNWIVDGRPFKEILPDTVWEW